MPAPGRRRRGRAAAAGFLALAVGAGCRPALLAPAPPPGGGLAARLLALHAEDGDPVDAEQALRRLDGIARDAALRISAAGSARERVDALNRFFFVERGFTADPDLEDPDNLRLDRVLERRRGYCTGLAAAYLCIAERLGLPVRAVATPGHLFLRYDDGETRINIETQEAGREISDATYRARDRIAAASVDRGVFLAGLTPDRFVSQIVNNLGALRSRSGDLEAAATYYRRALDLDPLNVTALFNLGRDRMRQGSEQEAMALFGQALELNPNDVRALTNRGVCRLRLGDRDGAVADFLAALAIDPEFAEARRNLAAAAAAPPPG